MIPDKLKGHLASATTYTIFGLNIVMCKDIANCDLLSPYALYLLRAAGATALFWLISLMMPREHVSRADMSRILVASFVGLFIPQMTFLVAITMTTSIDTSILSSFSPIMTMFVAAIALKEPITWMKAGGVALSFAGVMLLIFNTMHSASGVETSSPWGIGLIVLNCLSFAIYLGVFRPLISRYSVVTFMKWMFLFSTAYCLPFCLSDTIHTSYSQFPTDIILEIIYVVLFATFIAYFLVPIGQKHIRPTLVSLYSYLQPIIAVVISICIGMDHLSWQKVVAIVCVFAGVAIVSRSRSRSLPSETPHSQA